MRTWADIPARRRELREHSIPLVFREMQIETAMKCHCTTTRKAIIKNKDTNWVLEGGSPRSWTAPIAGGSMKGYGIVIASNLNASQKLNIHLPLTTWLGIIRLWHLFQRNKNYVHTKPEYQFHNVFMYINKIWNKSKGPSMGEGPATPLHLRPVECHSRCQGTTRCRTPGWHEGPGLKHK